MIARAWAACDDRTNWRGIQRGTTISTTLELIDVTLPFSAAFPVWPGDPSIEMRPMQRTENGDACNVTQLVCPTHCGTHVDPPRHFIHGGPTMSELPLERWVGPAQVIEIDSSVQRIESSHLVEAGFKAGTERLILKTSGSQKWSREPIAFETDFAALTTEAARWVVAQGVKLVGIDYLSIELYGGDGETHRTLLGNDVIVVEGLDLRRVAPGAYQLICMPLKIQEGDGAPARVALARLP